MNDEVNMRRIVLPGSTMKHGEQVNVFFLERAGGILVDVGWDTDASFEALRAALPEPPRHVLVTHLHPDHGGGVKRVAEWTGASVYVPDEDRAISNHPLPEDVRFFAGEAKLTFDGVTIDVLHTPGHTPGHRCFHFLEEGALATGDMVLGEGTTWVGPPHGDMARYMNSLERLRTVGHRYLCPGHGPIQADPLRKIDEFLAHRRMREAQVLEALAAGVHRPGEIVARNYTDTPEYLHGLAEVVVRAHLAKLVAESKVRDEGDDRFAPA